MTVVIREKESKDLMYLNGIPENNTTYSSMNVDDIVRVSGFKYSIVEKSYNLNKEGRINNIIIEVIKTI